MAVLGEFGFSPGAARVAMTRMVARNVIARAKSGRTVHYTITPHTAAILAEGDVRIFSLGRQDRHVAAPRRSAGVETAWTILWHTVPESHRVERSRLTRRLRFLGFGPIQDGTWIAPHNHVAEVAALLDEMQLRDHATVWTGRPSSDHDLRSVVARVWDVADLDHRYRAFVHEYRPYSITASDGSARHLDDRQALQVRTRLVHTFRQFPFADPDLPESLVSAPEHRAEAVDLFHDLYHTLAASAQRYFDKVTMP